MSLLLHHHFLLLLFTIIKRFPLFICLHRFVNNGLTDSLFFIIFFIPAVIYYVFLIVRMEIFKNRREGVVLVSIIKNEGDYLDEFIRYYLLIGFTKIVLYDNGSNDNTRMVLSKYIKDKKVIYHEALGKERQKDVYNAALNKFDYIFKYFCFFDIDEFLRINSFDSCLEIEQAFISLHNKNIGALAINMFLFGTSGHVKKPSGYVIENYLYRKKDDYHANFHTKIIVDSSKVLCIHNPHTPFLKKGYNYLSCNGNIVGWTKSNIIDSSHFVIYHYYTKSKEEYEEKRRKGDALQSKNIIDKNRILHSISELDADNIRDDYMLKYVVKL